MEKNQTPNFTLKTFFVFFLGIFIFQNLAFALEQKEKAHTTVTTASGLQYTDLQIGKGLQPQRGDKLLIHYSGYLLNGLKFSSSNDSRLRDPLPFTFTLGSGEVIPGLEEGIASMKVGGIRNLVIPPQLAYGNKSVEGIPAHATLLFRIELLGIR